MTMKILFLTIALDAMPFLPMIYSELRRLPREIDWEWHVCEGAARPTHCTSWCADQAPRLSLDGTGEYLTALEGYDERLNYYAKRQWDGKIEMVNHPLRMVTGDEEFLLWQMDSDEIWTAEQIVACWQMFKEQPEKNSAFFWCRYFVGPDKVITTRNCFGNYPSYEWQRVWKIKPGMLFKTHEPPVIEGLKINPFTHAETEERGLVFEHYSWVTRQQVEMKAKFYAGSNNPNSKHYKGLTERWERFQQETLWPRSLKEMMPWAEKDCLVEKI